MTQSVLKDLTGLVVLAGVVGAVYVWTGLLGATV